MFTEDSIIQYLKAQFTSPGGIGDDAAVFPFSNDESYVITQDLLIEDVHFRKRYFDAESLAIKSLEVNLSDVAAMAASPLYVMLGLSVSSEWNERFLNDFLQFFSQHCKKRTIQLIGGDTTASTAKSAITVTIIGYAKNNNLKYRHTANIGDRICVIGALGYAKLGLELLEKSVPGFDFFKTATLKPQALLDEAQVLGRMSQVTSLMDISDGLWLDLHNLCQASKCSAEIDVNSLPLSTEFISACRAVHVNPRTIALTGGEDYALLLTVSDHAFHVIDATFKQQLSSPFYSIGRITEKNQNTITLLEEGREISLHLKPFTHFGEGNS